MFIPLIQKKMIALLAVVTNQNRRKKKASGKWDHFFSTILNYVGDMNDPLKAVYAIGFTDYFSIENYKKLFQITK